MAAIQFRKFHTAWCGLGHLVRQHDRFRFNVQVPVVRENVELVNPIAVTVPVRRAARHGLSHQPE